MSLMIQHYQKKAVTLAHKATQRLDLHPCIDHTVKEVTDQMEIHDSSHCNELMS